MTTTDSESGVGATSVVSVLVSSARVFESSSTGIPSNSSGGGSALSSRIRDNTPRSPNNGPRGVNGKCSTNDSNSHGHQRRRRFAARSARVDPDVTVLDHSPKTRLGRTK
ncbi:MAG: hypothetical protein QM784_14395 [Polyangiaceae bacterium]